MDTAFEEEEEDEEIEEVDNPDKATGQRGRLRKAYLNTLYKRYINKDDVGLVEWIEGLLPELNRIFHIFRRRDPSREHDNFRYFLRRLILYKREYPYYQTAGDFDLLKHIILTDMRIDDFHETPITEETNAKWIDAFTRQLSQMEKHIKSLGSTSRQKRQEEMDVMKILAITPEDLRKSVSSARNDDGDWVDALPNME